MDTIYINDFRLTILIGVYEWERWVPQTVQFDIELAIPEQRAQNSDAIGETIDYARVVQRIEETLAEAHFLLLERLAEHVAGLVMGEFGSPWTRVSVTKLGALKNVKRLGVTIERGSRRSGI
jgi:7,8-dihydroneopterin aldolase/epimerase/oxygenase